MKLQDCTLGQVVIDQEQEIVGHVIGFDYNKVLDITKEITFSEKLKLMVVSVKWVTGETYSIYPANIELLSDYYKKIEKITELVRIVGCDGKGEPCTYCGKDSCIYIVKQNMYIMSPVCSNCIEPGNIGDIVEVTYNNGV